MEEIVWDRYECTEGEIQVFKTTWKGHQIKCWGWNNHDEDLDVKVDGKEISGKVNATRVRSLTPSDLDWFIQKLKWQEEAK